MNELALADALAAVAATCGCVGLSRARRGSFSRRRHLSIERRHLWLVGPALVVLLLPGPKLLTVPLALLVGIRLGRLLGSRATARRIRAMDAELPQLLDLLAAGSAAGLSALSALRRSVSALRGPLGQELRTSFETVDLGARWREELTALTDRLALPDLRRAIAVLIRTETLGASLTNATRELAADVRGARRAAVTERARAAPVKMLFPLVFLVLPAFLLLTVVPVLLTTVRSIR